MRVQACTMLLRSPTEYESTPTVSALMQSYFLKLLSRYRDFMEPDVEPSATSFSGHASHHHHHPHPHQQEQPPGALPRTGTQSEDDAEYLR